MNVVLAVFWLVDIDFAGIRRREVDVLGIVDGEGKGLEGSFCRRLLEGAVGVLDEGAVDESQVPGLDEGLCSFDGAVDEGEILSIPGDVFSLEIAVLDGDVMAVPEGILGIQAAFLDEDVPTMLEGILSDHVHVFYRAIAALQEGIVAFEAEVVDIEFPHLPEGLDAAEGRILDGDVVAFPQCLWRGHTAGKEGGVFDIPQRRPVRIGKGAFLDMGVMAFPKGVSGLEVAVVADDIVAFLDGAFAGSFKDAVLQDDIPLAEDLPFPVSMVADKCLANRAPEIFLGLMY